MNLFGEKKFKDKYGEKHTYNKKDGVDFNEAYKKFYEAKTQDEETAQAAIMLAKAQTTDEKRKAEAVKDFHHCTS